jgi:ubiquitin C-terminal hydrolase
MTQEETTLLGQLFFGSLSSSVACMRCGHLSISKEPISAGLQLPIETGMQSVEEMLHRFASVEALDLDVGYRCGKVKPLSF